MEKENIFFEKRNYFILLIIILVFIFIYLLFNYYFSINSKISNNNFNISEKIILNQSFKEIKKIKNNNLINENIFYVSKNGNDSNNGKNINNSFASIQHFLDISKPGDTLYILNGTYYETLKTKIAGIKNNPISIEGIGSNVILKTDGKDYKIFEINHDFYTLKNLIIDGNFTQLSNNSPKYSKKLLYVFGKEKYKGVSGLKIFNVTFLNALDECLRFRYFITNSEISYSYFKNCGIEDFILGGNGKNGEAIYIGTSSNQWADGKNPTPDVDVSSDNWIHHNIFIVNGNECIEVKEGSKNNLIEYNNCTGQLDNNSGGFSIRGDNNTIRNNFIYNNLGAGIRIGGHKVKEVEYGKGNNIYNNTFINNSKGSIKLMVNQQGIICGNKGNNLSISGSFRYIYILNQTCD